MSSAAGFQPIPYASLYAATESFLMSFSAGLQEELRSQGVSVVMSVVKIAGHPGKKPSLWVNRADFVRQCQRIDDFWVPYRDETHVEVKIYGRRIFTVDHQRYKINPANAHQAESGGTGAPDERFR